MRIFRRRGMDEALFQRPDGMPEPLYRLLSGRGIPTVDAARAFLRPNADMLNPPERLPGIKEAAGIVRRAVETGKKICVYGDYDVDGVSASSIMYMTLTRIGANVRVYLPSRHREGYGLNETAVREIAGDCDLMVTVDCGITSVELVRLAGELGLEVIVTDHHRPGEELPDCLIVNPLVGDYPDPYLCGAGVAFKLSQALLGSEAMDYVDIAALATVADVVPLTGENRVIVKLGLAAMNAAPRLGLMKLREAAGMADRPYTSSMLGFQIGPRLNASGRLGSAERAFELLTTQSSARAAALASELNAENSLRRQVEDEITSAAMKQLEGFDFVNRRAIVLAGDGWNSGVVGLAASRMVERFNYPTVMISLDGDVGVGSCRSIPGVDIFRALSAVSEHLVRFGGHAQAAGLTIERDRIGVFSDALTEYLRENIPPDTYIPVTEYDTDAQFSELDAGFVTLMEAFAPTGMGNPSPVFRTQASVSEVRRIGRDGSHLSIRVTDSTNYMRGVAFGEGYAAGSMPQRIDMVYAPKINEFRGRSSVELELKAFMPADGREIIARSKADGSKLLAQFLTEVLYNKRYSSIGDGIIAVEDIKDLLARSPQGTLIIAGDADAAGKLYDGRSDVFAGRYPDDPRCFNAICILPAGEMPGGYKNVIWAGLPAMSNGKMADIPRAGWTAQMPGVEELRRVYMAVKNMLARPVICENLYEYAVSMGDECRLSEACLTAGLLILIDMGLVVDRGGMKLEMGSFKKVSPETSGAFIAAKMMQKEV